MKRQIIPFEKFKTDFIENAKGGYYSVYSAFKEDTYSNYLRVVELDMICEWRLTDGKIIFIEVPFENEEQLNQIKEYLHITAGFLHREIKQRISKMDFKTTRKEPQE